MERGSMWRTAPVEVVFRGCHPDASTVDLCLQEVRLLEPHSRRIDACVVAVTEGWGGTEVRVDVRTAEGEVLVVRIASALDDQGLRDAIRTAFAQVAERMDEARHGVRTGATAASGEPPPCTFYG